MSDRRLLVRNSRAMKCIQKQVDEKVEEFNRATASSLQNSVIESIDQVERSSESSGLNNAETAVLVAGGVAAAGAGGLAVGATAIATKTAIVLFVFPVVAFSWPVFSAVGLTAIALAALSPAALRRARNSVERRCKKHLEQNIAQQLLAEADGIDPNSSWACFKMQIDDAARIRMNNLA